MTMAEAGHAALMDGVYRHQRHVYDLTRKYYLFGRDRLIAGLDAPPGGAVLEIGCGTGRNLARAARVWPDVRLFGIDISSEMLATAQRTLVRQGLNDRLRLACGDATGFDASALFGRSRFDRVFISYALSMIPDWEGAIAQAVSVLTPGGTLAYRRFRPAGAPAQTGTGPCYMPGCEGSTSRRAPGSAKRSSGSQRPTAPA